MPTTCCATPSAASATSSTWTRFVNVDFEDVRTVMSEPGKAMMGTASGRRARTARCKAAEAGGGVPAAGRHRPVRRARRAGADRGGQEQLQAGRKSQRDEHHPPLCRRRRARDLRRRLRRQPGRPDARHRDRHRPVAAKRQQQTPISIVHSTVRTGTARRADQRAAGDHRAHRGSQRTARLQPPAWRCRACGATPHRRRRRWMRCRASGMDEIEIPAFLRKQAD